MDLSKKGGSFSPTESEDLGMEAAQEVNLNTSTTSEEEEAAIEKRKEKVRQEIKEVVV